METNTFVIIIVSVVALYAVIKFLHFWLKPTGGNEGWIAETKPSRIWFRVTADVCRWFHTIYNRMDINNYEYLPKGQQFVTVANHASILDGFMMGGLVRQPLYIMVKKEAFERPIEGYFLRKVHCFPVDRSKVDATAIKTAMKAINEGHSLALFPEGTRNRKGYVSEFHAGAIKFALKKKLPIVPVYIANTHKMTPPGAIIPRPVKISMTLLEPIDTKAELEAGKTEKDILDLLYKRITDKGTEIMGYDVRDPEYLKSLENKSQPQTSETKSE